MARICIVNTGKTADTAGAAHVRTLGNGEANAFRSKPFRCFTAEGELRFVSLEMLQLGGASALAVRFALEFFGDDPSLGSEPNLRLNAPDVANTTVWPREHTEEVGAAGAVTHNIIVRSLALGAGVSAWLPMTIHAPWCRLKIWNNAAPPAGAVLLVWAHVGGHAEDQYLAQNGDTPYAYNA